MSRRLRIVRTLALRLVALFVITVITALLVIQTEWFRNYARNKLIAAIEEATGGRTEIGSLKFEVWHLHARLTNLVIHGTEPPTTPPFVKVAVVDLYVRPFILGRLLGISYLGGNQPQVNIMVFADGHTNIPTPKPSPPPRKTPLQTVVDLAIRYFELRNGLMSYNLRMRPLEIQANNLRAQLWYRLPKKTYEGRLSLDPIYVLRGRPEPLTVSVTVPLTLERDAIRVQHAQITSPDSRVQIDASLEDWRHPVLSGHIHGGVSLATLKSAGVLRLEASPRELRRAVSLDLKARGPVDKIQVTALDLALGQSRLAAKGTIKPAQGTGTMDFNGRLALTELARLLRSSVKPGGTLELHGEAVLEANRRYRVSSHVAGQNLALEQGRVRIRQVNLSTDVQLIPGRLALNRLRLDALGAEFDGEAALENFTRYQMSGGIRHLDLQQVLRVLGKRFPYDGLISGSVEAIGELKVPAVRRLDARTLLTIAPGRRGIPLRGRLEAQYSGTRDDLAVQNSYLALPHTRLTMAGSVRQRLDVSLVTRDLRDLPAIGSRVALNGGQATFTGAVTGMFRAPIISGTLAADHFAVQGHPFDALRGNVAVSPAAAAVQNGSILRGPMQASFSGSVGLRSWSPAPNEPLNVDATMQDADLADLIAMAGQPSQNFSGALGANLHIAGTVGNPRGSALVHVARGTMFGEPFDLLDAQANLLDQLVTIPSATLTAGSAHVDLSAEFRHPRDSFRTGTIHARLRTNSVDLAQVRTLKNQSPSTAGTVQASAEAAGVLTPTQFLLTSLQADASARGLRFQGQPYGDLQLQARTSGQNATLNLASDFAGSRIHVQANTQLVQGYPTTADLQVSGLAIERALAAANRTDIPAKGILSANAHIHGTLQNPEGNATLDLANGALFNEPVDRVHAQIQLLAQRVDVPQFELAAGPARVDLSGRFDHPAGRFDTGTLQFRIGSTGLDLARVRNVQNLRPGLAGSVAIFADGAAVVRTAAPRVLLTSLEANMSATHLAASGTPLGGLTLAAHTTAGNRLDFKLSSNLAESSIEATGSGQLSGDYPITAQVSFRNVCWTNLAPLLGTSIGGPGSFDATAEGKISLSGPILRANDIRGSLDLSQLAVVTLPPTSTGRSVTFKNAGAVAATIDGGMIRIDRFHLTGPQTDVTAAGTIGLQGGTMNVTAGASIDLAVLESFNRDITSSGSVKLTAAIRGTVSDPMMSGQIELQGASVNYAAIPVGLGNATGVVLLRGNRATLQSVTGELGGGRLAVTGFTTLGSNPQLGLHATAERVRVRMQAGVSIIAAADVRITGTLARSTASGTMTLEQLNYAPKNDLGSMLQRTAPAVETVVTPSPLLDNMKLDIRVRSSPATRVQSSLAEGLQVDADLRMTGTAARPALLGRINLNQGKLTFFGSTYTINSGVIAFYNPTAIQPILNLSLETQARGVDVTLNVSGPIDNMKLTYTSNPPLQFQEILGLLSTGAIPTSDPTLLANQPATAPQTMQQVGESAILSQAVANPVATRLQRVFGVSQLRVDPTFIGYSQLPTAQVTLQQQVSQRLTVSYVSAVDVANSTLIRAEFMLNQRWSATAVRDQNGIVSVNLVYKRQFR